jgi:hypothetical protein
MKPVCSMPSRLSISRRIASDREGWDSGWRSIQASILEKGTVTVTAPFSRASGLAAARVPAMFASRRDRTDTLARLFEIVEIALAPGWLASHAEGHSENFSPNPPTL